MVQRYNTICFAEWDVDESGLGLRRLQRRLATDWLGAHVTLKIKDNPKRLGVKARERGLKKRGRETERLAFFLLPCSYYYAIYEYAVIYIGVGIEN